MGVLTFACLIQRRLSFRNLSVPSGMSLSAGFDTGLCIFVCEFVIHPFKVFD